MKTVVDQMLMKMKPNWRIRTCSRTRMLNDMKLKKKKHELFKISTQKCAKYTFKNETCDTPKMVEKWTELLELMRES